MFQMCSQSIIALGILTGNSIADLKQREILLLPSLLCILSGICYQFLALKSTFFTILCTLLPAIMMFLFSLLLPGQIGMGDAIAAAAAIIWESPFGALSIVSLSFFFAMLFAGHLFFRKKTVEIPFVPFLLLSECLWILGLGGSV